MDLRLKDKIVLITGGSRGIGYATAQRFAEEGAKLAICARGEEDLQKAAESLRNDYGAEVFSAVADVTKPEDIERLVKSVLDHYGTVDVLVNNAGTATPGPFESISDEKWLYDYDASLMSMVRLCRAVLPKMKEQRSGAIINVTALIGREPRNGIIVGCSNRAAVMSFTKGLSNEVAEYGIRVNGVNIGVIWTSMRERAWKNTAPEKTKEEFLAPAIEPIPLGRAGEPGEVADAIVYLSSDRASYITGSNIDLGGGIGRSAF